MGIQIEDGGGTGRSVEVDNNNHLVVTAVMETIEHYENDGGNAYNLLFDATPSGAGDCFLYVKNSEEDPIVIEGLYLKLAADEYIDIKIGDTGTPVGGGAITPANLNSGSATSLTGTFQDGNDITGLSGGTTVMRLYHASSNGSTYVNFDQDIILQKNGVLTMYCETGTTALAGMISMFKHTGVHS